MGKIPRPPSQYYWLRKRAEIKKTKARELAKIDEEAREEAAHTKMGEKLESRKKLISEEQAKQKFFAEERNCCNKARAYFQPWWRKKRITLRRVPKNSIVAREGTSVLEAVEVEREKGLDYGERKVLSSSSWANMSQEDR